MIDGNRGQQMNSTKGKRNGAIDFWKFIFSIALVLLHSINFTELENTPFKGGSIFVEFFFIVSGFLMAESISHYELEKATISKGKAIQKFIIHKIRGMCPEVIIAWIIGFSVSHIAQNGVTVKILFKDFIMGIIDFSFLWGTGLSSFRANTAAWYISAMLLAMMLLLPIFIDNPELFLKVLAPLISVFILGYISKTVGNLRGPSKWMGFCYKGLLRAIAEISLGCVCWNICQWLKNFHFKKLGRLLFSMAESICYLGILAWGYQHQGSQMDFVIVLMFAVAITITFSKHGIISPLFDNKFMYFLGKISFPIYLGHGYWSHALARLYPEESYGQLIPKYFLVIILTSTIIFWVSKGIRRISPQISLLCRKYLLEDIKQSNQGI